MAIASTASSGTDEPEGGTTPEPAAEDAGGQAPPPGDPDRRPPSDRGRDEPTTHDAARRAFFREFGKQAVTAVGQVAAMTDIVGRVSSSAAASLLGLDERQPDRAAPAFGRSGRTASPGRAPARPAAEDVFRSPFRLVGDELILLDQRRIPEALDEVVARRGSDVAYYLRLGACRGGPVMAQAAAYGLALTAAERQGHPAEARALELRRTRNALRQARPSSRLVGWAMDRLEAVEAALGPEASGEAMAAALRDEADAIATGFQAALATISAAIAELLPVPPERPLAVLLHGDSGALRGGLLGTGLTALRAIVEGGRPVQVYVTEGRPFMDGARLAAWELRQGGVAHRIIPDAAVAWLLARETIDAILVDAEWVAANGDCAALIGARGIAQEAAASRHPDAVAPRLIVSALSATIDPATRDGVAIPEDLRPARELGAYLADVPVRATDALVPATDVVPAALIGALVTERGVATPVAAETISALGLAPVLEPGPSGP